MNKKIFLLLPALGLLLCGCPDKGGNVVPPIDDKGVKAVEVDHDAVSLEVGQTFQLAASVKPITLEDRTYTWSSDAATVANVDASGMVTAIEVGTAHIRATANADTTKYAECTVTVTPEMVTVPMTNPAEIIASTETLKFGANQKNVGKYYFFTGELVEQSGARGQTSESWASGVEVKLESAGENKYYVTFNDAEGKKYLEMDDGHHPAIVSTPTEGREWAWNATYATVQRTIGSTTYLPGTYNTYTTISGCDLAQAASDFFFQFVYQTEPVAPTSITLNAESNKIYQGGTLQINAELAPIAAKGNLVWTVTGDEHVTISQKGLLSATQEATLDAAITVRAAYAEDENIYGELALTVAEYINYGTLEAPLTIAEAKAVIDKFPSGSVTPEKLFVKGFVSLDHAELSTSKRGDVWLASDDGSVQKSFELYSVYADASLTVAANSLVGKEVIAEGWCTIFKGTYEFSAKNPSGSYDNGFIRAITSNTRTATSVVFDPAETFEIAQGGNQAVTGALYPYGAAGSITYAVSPANQGVTYENGKVVAAADATAGNYTLTATSGNVNGSLAFTVVEASGSIPVSKEINTAIGQWTVTGDGTSSEQATLASDPFNLVYNIGTATTYISSYSSNTGYAIRFYAGSNVSISWGNTIKVQSITFTTNSKHFATNATFTGGALDSSYTAQGDTCKVNVEENATSLSWNNAAQVRLDKVVIVYTVA